MALRDQPYLPLYIQDIMTDEKLNECCAATHGIYIKGIMCLMHKSETYGKILLKQKFKQSDKQHINFALQLAKHFPYTVDEISAAIFELISEQVCHFEDDYLVQKRMVHDNDVSEKRASAGKNGGKKTQGKNDKIASNFAKAKSKANTEYEYVIENTNNNVLVLSEVEIGKTIEFIKITGQRLLTSTEVLNYWQAFLIHSKDDFHLSNGDMKKHFRNWIKKQPHENNKRITADASKPGTIREAL